jgi:hypothetical protein
MSIAIGLRLPLALAFLVFWMGACSSASVKPSIPPTAPEVRCKQPATPDISAPPAEDEWVDSHGLSERAAVWITELLATVTKERSYRRIEHQCLDAHEARGTIRQ